MQNLQSTRRVENVALAGRHVTRILSNSKEGLGQAAIESNAQECNNVPHNRPGARPEAPRLTGTELDETVVRRNLAPCEPLGLGTSSPHAVAWVFQGRLGNSLPSLYVGLRWLRSLRSSSKSLCPKAASPPQSCVKRCTGLGKGRRLAAAANFAAEK